MHTLSLELRCTCLLYTSMADPMDMVALDDFSIVTNLQVEPAVATGRDILLTLSLIHI